MNLKLISLSLSLLLSFSLFSQVQDTVVNSTVIQNQTSITMDEYQPTGPKKSVFLSGLLSFVVPGAGQLYNGKMGSAALFIITNIACNTVMKTAKVNGDQNMYTMGLAGGLAVNLFAVIDACTGASQINFERGYRKKVRFTLAPHIGRNPDLTATNASSGNNYGLSLNMQF